MKIASVEIKEKSHSINVRCTLSLLSLFLHLQLQTAVLVGPVLVHGGTLSDPELCVVCDAVVFSR